MISRREITFSNLLGCPRIQHFFVHFNNLDKMKIAFSTERICTVLIYLRICFFTHTHTHFVFSLTCTPTHTGKHGKDKPIYYFFPSTLINTDTRSKVQANRIAADRMWFIFYLVRFAFFF